ncbi:hypothetical protein [Bradyrhizobium sp. CCBAU 53380]|uniref:hypothetical protein n=1 Tax=Bradyrhizobium sp. CCBAU 53380 TaxID=1325117 RepID=UPI002304C8A4|nr:hypothetical protein [Bradyrhizobium sp. CCBAU 53380]MDA9424026.1 hypothetical protein [Bradyrhizobium sp. CCBAU 53380]
MTIDLNGARPQTSLYETGIKDCLSTSAATSTSHSQIYQIKRIKGTRGYHRVAGEQVLLENFEACVSEGSAILEFEFLRWDSANNAEVRCGCLVLRPADVASLREALKVRS